MDRQRLDQALVGRGLVATRSQAESYIKLGEVKVNGRLINKPGFLASPSDKIVLAAKEQYVSRAALKLASVADTFRLDFKDKTVLDVGSSTGGFIRACAAILKLSCTNKPTSAASGQMKRLILSWPTCLL
jgi:23S rRNA (cytidine1920-2'-O)/16S rRNA (cytidine1409-2'-O)-methyltransferase